VVILETPVIFRAVAESYENWYDVGDDEVIKIMQKGKNWLIDSVRKAL
jgi:putative phosphoribosyl transferase